MKDTEAFTRDISDYQNSPLATSVNPPKTEAEQIRRLQHEVEFLKQEMEFLKKFFLIRNARNQVHCS